MFRKLNDQLWLLNTFSRFDDDDDFFFIKLIGFDIHNKKKMPEQQQQQQKQRFRDDFTFIAKSIKKYHKLSRNNQLKLIKNLQELPNVEHMFRHPLLLEESIQQFYLNHIAKAAVTSSYGDDDTSDDASDDDHIKYVIELIEWACETEGTETEKSLQIDILNHIKSMPWKRREGVLRHPVIYRSKSKQKLIRKISKKDEDLRHWSQKELRKIYKEQRYQ